MKTIKPIRGIRNIKTYQPDLLVSCNLLTVAERVNKPPGMDNNHEIASKEASEILGLANTIKIKTTNINVKYNIKKLI